MNKTILKILVIISIIIILLGIFSAISIRNELKNEGMPKQNVYMDGSNVTGIIELFVEFGSGILAFIAIIFSILVVGSIWGIYGIVILIFIIIKKYKERNRRIE